MGPKPCNWTIMGPRDCNRSKGQQYGSIKGLQLVLGTAMGPRDCNGTAKGLEDRSESQVL